MYGAPDAVRIILRRLQHGQVAANTLASTILGHGGHMEHALQWFGGLSGKPVREMCPTGCGHKCNMMQPLSAFPRTESLRDLAQSDHMEIIP
jgi:hypothetical protein